MDRADHLGEPVMQVALATEADRGDWLALRVALWPDSAPEGPAEVDEILREPQLAALIARDAAGRALGFAEVSLRTDYVSGCESSPVGFLEGIYVMPEARMQGVARALVDAAAAWARSQGCSEFASDALLDNVESHAMHTALGFEETSRVVNFRKAL